MNRIKQLREEHGKSQTDLAKVFMLFKVFS